MNDPRVLRSIEAFVAAWNEHDPAVRRGLIARACADGFRMVTPGRCIVGREGLDALMADFQQRRPEDRARLASAVEIFAHSFRYVGVVERPDGTTLENLDTGEHDAEGRLVLVLTFAGAVVALPVGPKRPAA